MVVVDAIGDTHHMIHGTLSDLKALLSLETLGNERFVAAPRGGSRWRVYGGQFLGQGLIAATHDVELPVRSFHAYFIRAGDATRPMYYEVERSSDEHRLVRAHQEDKLLFTMEVALGEYGSAPIIPMPAVPEPEACIPREKGVQNLDADTESTWAVVDSPFDNRFVENIWHDEPAPPQHHVWFRTRQSSVPDNRSPMQARHMHQAVLAYYADDTIMDNALFPHGWSGSWERLQTTSLDHAMWFHADIPIDTWLLHAQDSPAACGGRGMTRGLIYRRSGELVASATQEILMRPNISL